MKSLIVSLVAIATLASCTSSGHRQKRGTANVNFNTDYRIDLKQDHYLLIDEAGNTHVVVYGQLEEFFLDDNL